MLSKKLSLREPKKCTSCGLTYLVLPSETASNDGKFHWFNCLCHSTLIMKTDHEVTTPPTFQQNNNEIFRLIYRSEMTKEISFKELKLLSQKARHFNKTRSISGFLLFTDSSFIQFLEGKSKDLHSLMRKISKDKRHCNIEIVEYEKIESRIFDKWGSGYFQSYVSRFLSDTKTYTIHTTPPKTIMNTLKFAGVLSEDESPKVLVL